MAMKYSQVPTDTFEHLQLGAGMIVKTFTPATGEVTGIMGATSGGASFTDVPTYTDYGEDIDNVPSGTKELLKIDDREITLSYTFLTLTAESAKQAIGAVDSVDESGVTKFTPRDELKSADFQDVWWVGDYSDTNTGTTAGFIAIHLKNTLNTGGFSMQSQNKGKGQFAVSLKAHYSLDDIDSVPYEMYIKEGA